MIIIKNCEINVEKLNVIIFTDMNTAIRIPSADLVAISATGMNTTITANKK